MERAMPELAEVLFEYTACANPTCNDDLRRYLRLYPEHREEIIDFTATWRAMLILDETLPAPRPEPVVERRILRRAKARYRALRRA
jgi:hypothetical protein